MENELKQQREKQVPTVMGTWNNGQDNNPQVNPYAVPINSQTNVQNGNNLAAERSIIDSLLY